MPDIPSIRHHLLIAGTGRAGTSVLVRLLTECGMSTELSPNPQAPWNSPANAGAESFPLSPGEHPYVIKSPWAYQYIRQLLDDPNIRIDEILIPIRQIAEATASRVIQELRQKYNYIPDLVHLEDPWSDWGTTAGGVTYSLEPIDQARILAHSLHVIIENAEKRDIPYRFLSFPRFLEDPKYLYHRIKHILRADLSLDEFCQIVSRVYIPASVRVEQELENLKETLDAGPLSRDLPSLSSLEQVAMKREISDLKTRLTALEQLTSVSPAGNIDHNGTGISFGDMDILDGALHGWHIVTLLRPTNLRYGVQIALSDTSKRIGYRIKVNETWSCWQVLRPDLT